VTTALKAISQQEFQNIFPIMAAS